MRGLRRRSSAPLSPGEHRAVLNGAELAYHDPYIPRTEPTRKYDFRLDSEPLTPENIASKDLVIIVTDHDNVDYAALATHAKLIVDTRNALRKRSIDVTGGRLVHA